MTQRPGSFLGNMLDQMSIFKSPAQSLFMSLSRLIVNDV